MRWMGAQGFIFSLQYLSPSTTTTTITACIMWNLSMVGCINKDIVIRNFLVGPNLLKIMVESAVLIEF